jgi:hypothetical protein
VIVGPQISQIHADWLKKRLWVVGSRLWLVDSTGRSTDLRIPNDDDSKNDLNSANACLRAFSSNMPLYAEESVWRYRGIRIPWMRRVK